MSLLQRIEVFRQTKKAKLTGKSPDRDQVYAKVAEHQHVHLVTYITADAAGPVPIPDRPYDTLQADIIARRDCKEHKQQHRSSLCTSNAPELSESPSAPCEAPDARSGQQAEVPESENHQTQDRAHEQREASGDQASVSGEDPRKSLWEWHGGLGELHLSM